jgi:prepilin-type N-terminal cleavage/methylation domain-containing protein
LVFKKGHSLAELLIAVVLITILAAIAVPRINFSITTAKGAEAVAVKISTDLRRGRRLALSDAAGNTDGYRVRMNGASPYSGYDIVNLKTSAVLESHQFDSGINVTGGSSFDFGPMGNLLGGSGSTIDVAGGGKSFTLTITTATGMVTCVEN